MRGRKPVPRRLRVLTGVPERQLRSTPEPAPRKLACPAWLPKLAKAEWRRLAPELQRLGILTQLDRALFAGYCCQYATYRTAVASIERDGTTYAAPGGLVKRNPACTVADQALKSMRLLADAFGLTPLGRQRLDVNPASDEVDALQAFLEDAASRSRPALPPPAAEDAGDPGDFITQPESPDQSRPSA